MVLPTTLELTKKIKHDDKTKETKLKRFNMDSFVFCTCLDGAHLHIKNGGNLRSDGRVSLDGAPVEKGKRKNGSKLYRACLIFFG
jgi:hypothetical protein